MTGCPIRTSQDQSLFDGSPGLIAAYHVLHRLVTPRHSPCTLTSLAAFVVDPQTFTVGRQTKPSRFGTSRFHFAFTEKITSATPYPVVKEPWRPADPIGLLACFIFPDGLGQACGPSFPIWVKLCTAFRSNRQLNSLYFPEKFQTASSKLVGNYLFSAVSLSFFFFAASLHWRRAGSNR